ncbi:MAG TPA: glycosyltransferase family 4 protein [Nocardioidaceae bacterium]|nr:glycosyltransferase family 4 protein [Nocardioidaceae bacterium]
MPSSDSVRESTPDKRPRVYFLVSTATSPGGLVRVVLNLANRLVDHFDVEIISIFRRGEAPFYQVDDRVRVTYLYDERAGHEAISIPWLRPLAGRLEARRSSLAPRQALKDQRMSLLTDVLTWRYLRSLEPGILVSTHPSLHVASVRFARRGMVKVGQEHMSFEGRNDQIQQILRRYAPRLDAMVTLTASDLEHFTRLTQGSDTVVHRIPNALPWGAIDEGAALTNKVVVAAGALLPRKGFGRLIDAFAPVAAKHPDWQLHIYGQGRKHRFLKESIRRKGLQKQVALKGQTNKIEDVLLSSSVFALSSHYEGWAMVVAEAMSKGVPVVAFDCPSGPADIITHGRDGFLVPDGDLAEFTRSLLLLIEDDDRRRQMGSAALQAGHRFDPHTIGQQWVQMFEELARRSQLPERGRSRSGTEG